MSIGTEPKEVVRIAAMADLHCSAATVAGLRPAFAAAPASADILVLCGDMTDRGLPDEARVLARELSLVKVPMVGVLGNHDFDAGQQETIARILAEAGVVMLDGTVHEVRGIGMAGVKGFAGGFGRRALAAWGEPIIKSFVREAVEEGLKLESALAKLRTPVKVALLHYSPIAATVQGEPPEVHAFLGSTRLEEPVDRYRASLVFHGHAHHGTPEGVTKANIPVYNVAVPLLRLTNPGQPPFRVVEVTVTG